MLAVDSLLGLTCLFWAGLSRLHPLFCLPPAMYLLRPEGLRELIFHGLLPPEWAPMLWLLALPALGSRGTSAPGVAR
jgi:hypothetical protein